MLLLLATTNAGYCWLLRMLLLQSGNESCSDRARAIVEQKLLTSTEATNTAGYYWTELATTNAATTGLDWLLRMLLLLATTKRERKLLRRLLWNECCWLLRNGREKNEKDGK